MDTVRRVTISGGATTETTRAGVINLARTTNAVNANPQIIGPTWSLGWSDFRRGIATTLAWWQHTLRVWAMGMRAAYRTTIGDAFGLAGSTVASGPLCSDTLQRVTKEHSWRQRRFDRTERVWNSIHRRMAVACVVAVGWAAGTEFYLAALWLCHCDGS